MMKNLLIKGLFVAIVIFPLLGIAQHLKQKEISVKPVIPVGLDSYRMWDMWPIQRIGVRAYMRSTYDRTGGNESADASHFLFANDENHNVTLDVKGKGILYFFRANHWHGSPWHFIVDNEDNVVQETATSDPVNAIQNCSVARFIPEEPFPQAMNWTWTTTKGADLIWTPIPFEESLRLAYSRTKYGTGYYIYNLFADENNLSQPVKSWNIQQVPGKDVTDLIGRAGADIAPLNIATKRGTLKLEKEKVLLAAINCPSSVVRAFKLVIPFENINELERLRLQITWDNAKYPSVDAPLCLFFGAGTFYNRDNREYLVKGFPINIRYDYPNQKVELSCYYPMPFFKSARFELVGIKPGKAAIDYEIRFEPLQYSENFSSYFHATYNDFSLPEPGKDLVFLNTKGIEGNEDWSGSFAGTSFIFSHNGFLGTLEGDPRFFFDDSQTPQAYGTGTEEWGGGGDYWGGENMTLPFAGHPCGCAKKELVKDAKDLIESGYRFLLADLMPFGRRAVIRFEHGGENLSTEHYESVTYWYGLPAPSLIQTDEVDVGNLASEKEHAYNSPEASEIKVISSRYELGINVFPENPWGFDKNEEYKNLKGQVVYPESVQDGRFTMGVSEFTIKLDPKNLGALLRRTLDYSFPNQTADVFLETGADNNLKWEKAGTWYLAGSNTCLFSNPPGELDKRLFKVETSNRSFRDDEFLIPANLIKGKSQVRVRIVHIPNDQKLHSEIQFPEKNAWSELKYVVYSYVEPNFHIKN